ncbi:hypothetical protein DdX_19107 [Ditylenchus destructor]|uniref:Uncharacterized protein n=1 Tax=Ditylenchus destructor TaxID=166010 RepID=A0AAD4MJR9_9BILA|nr:hypothetical protein DdX_19107 [Ditylenchus destructor]
MDLDYMRTRFGILKFLQMLYFKFDYIALASAACFLYGSITYCCHLFSILKIHRWVLQDDHECIRFARKEMWLSACFSLIFWTAMFIIFATTSDPGQRAALPNATLYILAGIVSGLLAGISGHYAYQIGCKVYPRIQTSGHSDLDHQQLIINQGAAALLMSTQ